jgi:hypothetical protein
VVEAEVEVETLLVQTKMAVQVAEQVTYQVLLELETHPQ